MEHIAETARHFTAGSAELAANLRMAVTGTLLAGALQHLPNPDRFDFGKTDERERRGKRIRVLPTAVSGCDLQLLADAAARLRADWRCEASLRGPGQEKSCTQRWWLVPNRRGAMASEAIWLDNLWNRSGEETGAGDEPLCDHPWNLSALVLDGTVVEEDRKGERRELKTGSGTVREAGHASRMIAGSRPALVLCRSGRRKHQWGFFNARGRWQRSPDDRTDLPR